MKKRLKVIKDSLNQVLFFRIGKGVFTFIILLNTSKSIFCQCNPTVDSLALVSLFNSTGGPNWIDKTNWLVSGQPIGSWYGIQTYSDGCVRAIDLDGIPDFDYFSDGGNNLNGSIPASLGNLSRIWYLSLNENASLVGSIPPALGNLTTLTNLRLAKCGLSGSIPSSLGNHILNWVLELQDNQLTGSIPSSFGALTNLRLLDLRNNQLTGNIPSQLGNIGNNLYRLGLDHNMLSGSIPMQLGNLHGVTDFWLGVNNLTGTIPKELEGLTSAIYFFVDYNNLSGCIPIELQTLCSHVIDGRIGNNPLLLTQDWSSFCTFNQGVCCATFSISITGSTSLCVGSSTTLQATTGYDQYLWNTGATSNSITGLSAGTYTVTVTNSSNCTATASVTVTNAPLVIANAGSDKVLSCTSTSVTLNGSATGGAGPWSYNWSGPSGFMSMQQNPIVTATGTYTVVVTNQANGCTDDDTVNVTEDITVPSVSLTASNGGAITCSQPTVVLTAAASGSGPFTYAWSGGTSNPPNKRNVTIAGNYTVTVTNTTNGCTGTNTIIVTGNSTPPTVSLTSTGAITCSQPTVILTAAATGSGPFTYTWSGGTSNPMPHQRNITVAGSYTVTVTNTTNNCTGTNTILITGDAIPPSVGLTGSGAITCSQPTVVLTATASGSGPFTYAWSGGTSNPMPNKRNITVAGSYTVTVTNTVNSCTGTSNIMVTADITSPTVSLSSSGVITCSQAIVVLTATASGSGPFTYLWNGGANNPVLNKRNITVAGNYTVTVTNTLNGCTGTDNIFVAANNTPPAATITTPSGTSVITCVNSVGLEVDVASGSGAYTYQWKRINVNIPGATATSFNAILSGAYTVVVTDIGNGCSTTATALNVTQNITVPVANAGPVKTMNCVMPEVQLTGTASSQGANFEYLWTTVNGNIVSDETTLTPIVNNIGTYSLTVTNSINGCTASSSVSVTANYNEPTPVSAGTNQTINCNTPTVTLIGSGQPATSTFFWKNSTTGATWNTKNITVNQSQIGVFTLTVTHPSSGCTATAQVTVTSNIIYPIVDAGANLAITCDTPEVILQGSGSANSGNQEIIWTKIPATPTFSSAELHPSTAYPGTYTLTIKDLNNGCTATDQMVVSVNNTLVAADAGADKSISCASPSATLVGTSTSPGNLHFSWTGPNGFQQSGQSVTVNIAGAYTLSVSDNDTGCEGSDEVIVTETSFPANAGPNKYITCAQNTVVLDGSASAQGADYVYTWTGPNNFTSGLISPSASVPGLYKLSVMHVPSTCIRTDTMTVFNNTTPPILIIPVDTLNCYTPMLPLQPVTNAVIATYNWTGPSEFVSSESMPQVNLSGNYFVTITNTATGCTNSAQTIVYESFTTPNAFASGGEITCSTSSITLNGNSSTNGVSYSWSGPNGYVSIQQNPNVNNSGTYTLTVQRNDNGCTAIVQSIVQDNTTAPSILANGTTLTCTQQTGHLTGTSTTSGVTYVWNGPSNFFSNNPTPQVNTMGNYILTVSGPNGCTATATAIVTIDDALPNASATGGIITCAASTASISGNTTTNGASLAWNGPGGFMSDSAVVNVNTIGVYTLIVTGLNGCTSSATAVVQPDGNLPNVTAVGDTITCTQTMGILSGNSSTPNTVISWSGPGGFVSSENNPQVTIPGSYTCTVSISGGCSVQTTVALVKDITPVSLAPINDTLTCTDSQIVLQAISNPPAMAWLWSGPGGFNSVEPSPLTSLAGIYSVSATGSNGCISTTSLIISAETNLPQLTVSGGEITCSQTSVNLFANSNMNGPYSWSGPGGYTSSLQNPVVVLPGFYEVTQIVTNGCMASVNVEVEISNSLPDISTTDAEIGCVSGNATLNGSSSVIGVQYLWNGPGGFISALQNPSVSELGLYILTVTAPNGCTATTTANVIGSTSIPIATITGDGIFNCNVDSINLYGISTIPNSTFQWSTPGNSILNQQNIIATQPGDYTLLVSNPANNCSDHTTITLLQDISPPASAASGGILNCLSGNLMLDGSSSTLGASFHWTGPNDFTSMAEDPNVTLPGNYLLTVTGPNGCMRTATATVTADQNTPNASAVGGMPCLGPITLEGNSSTPGATFQWIGPGNFTAAEEDPVAFTPGTYILTVSAPNGCTNVATAEVLGVLGAALDFEFSTCFGLNNGMVSAIAFIGGDQITLPNTDVTLTWSGNAPSPESVVQNNAPVGQYVLTLTHNTSGCTSTASGFQGQPAPVTVIGTSDPACPGSADGMVNFTVAGGTAPYVYTSNVPQWPSGTMNGSMAVLDNLIAGSSLTITITDANGCTSEAYDIDVSTLALPEITITGGIIGCLSDTAIFVADAPNAAQFNWSGPAGYSGSGATQSVVQTGTYTVTVTDQNGCTQMAEASAIHDQNLPIVDAGADQINCVGQGSTFTTSAGLTDYVWYDANGLIVSTGPTLNVNPNVAGQHVYIITAIGANGCTGADTVLLQTGPSMNAAVSGNLTPCITPYGTVLVATGGDVYTWSNGQANDSLWVYPDNTTMIPLTVAIANTIGCKDTISVEVQAQPTADVEIQGADVLCLGASSTLKATGNPSSFRWDNNTQQQTRVVSPQATTQYWVIGFLSNGNCPDTAYLTVNVEYPAIVNAGADQTICSPEAVLNAELPPNSGTGLWIPIDNGNVSHPDMPLTTVTGLSTGVQDFAWQVMSSVCEDVKTDTMSVSVVDEQPFALSDKVNILPEQVALFSVLTNDSTGHLSDYTLDLLDADLNGSWSLDQNGMLNFEPLSDFKGDATAHYILCNALCPEICSEAEIKISIVSPEGDVGETVAITPDGTPGQNDFLYFDYLDNYKDNSIFIFNRWGQKVYEMKPYPNKENGGWRGTYNGKPLPAGTYFYILNLEGEDNKVWGNVLIVR